MEGRILQPARQTLVTLAKDGQLLCIPDEVRTSVSGENKRGVDVAPVGRPKHLGLTTAETFLPPARVFLQSSAGLCSSRL